MVRQVIQSRRYGHGGPTVVLLHGGPGASGEMTPLAVQLSDKFNVIAPLQRGGGALPLTVAVHVADLHQVLESLPGDEAVRLVGFSWGAMLALTYAARHPARVDRVVAIGCGTFDKNARRIYQTRMAERTNEATRRRMSDLQASLACEKDQPRRDELFAELGRICSHLQAFDPIENDSPDLVHCDEQAFRETWADAVSLQEHGLQPAEFSRITAPVTMLHGDADPHPGRLICESLRPFIAQLTYLELPHCGHKPWIERQTMEAFHTALSQRLIDTI
jgi:pimeloyl-ACP methyl ester carboxylesterase